MVDQEHLEVPPTPPTPPPAGGGAVISDADVHLFQRRRGAIAAGETPAAPHRPAAAPAEAAAPANGGQDILPPRTIEQTVFTNAEQARQVSKDTSSAPVIRREGRRTFLVLTALGAVGLLAYGFREVMTRGKVNILGLYPWRSGPENFRYSVETNNWILLLENRDSKNTMIQLLASYGSPKNYNFNYSRNMNIYDNSTWQGSDLARYVESLYPFYKAMETETGRAAIIKGIENYPSRTNTQAPANDVILRRAKASLESFNRFVAGRKVKDFDDVSLSGVLLDYWSSQDRQSGTDFTVIFNRILEISKARNGRQPAVFDADLTRKIDKYITDYKLGYPLLPLPPASMGEEQVPEPEVAYTRREFLGLLKGQKKT